jgi:hypothetical protein
MFCLLCYSIEEHLCHNCDCCLFCCECNTDDGVHDCPICDNTGRIQITDAPVRWQDCDCSDN